MQTVLAIDLGGTSLRAALVLPDGQAVALAARGHRIGDEANPADWWRALGEVLAELPDAEVANAEVAGIGLCGFTRTQVLTDAAGTPLRPALCFTDGRATAEAAALAESIGDGWTAMTAYHPLARLAWVARHEPAVLAATRHVLQPKDWLALRLTGRATCDRIGNAWAMERRGPEYTGKARSLALFRQAGIDPSLLPDVLNPWDRVGQVRHLPEGAPDWLEGLPVFTGSMDTWCASIGAGAGQVGDAYLISGTTDAGGVLTTAPVQMPGLVSLPWGEGVFHIGGPSNAGAACLTWLAGMLGMPDAAAISALAEIADPQAPPLLFLPSLSGERAPGWQPQARGGFIGLHHSHGPAELARAVLLGVAFADRDLLSGADFSQVLIAGGGARSDLWCQMRADVLGRLVRRAAAAEPGIIGAALLAWIGLGQFADLAAAQAGLAGSSAAWTPDAAGHAEATRLYRLYQRFRAAGLELSQALVA
jgi:xylulokinase